MDQLSTGRSQQLKTIARSLFWLNLPPAAMVLTIIILMLTNHHWDNPVLYLLVAPIWLDIVAEVIYFMQFRRERWLEAKQAWLFSAIIHSLFIPLVVAAAVITETYVFLIFLIYPFMLLRSSYQGWKLVKGIERQHPK